MCGRIGSEVTLIPTTCRIAIGNCRRRGDQRGRFQPFGAEWAVLREGFDQSNGDRRNISNGRNALRTLRAQPSGLSKTAAVLQPQYRRFMVSAPKHRRSSFRSPRERLCDRIRRCLRQAASAVQPPGNEDGTIRQTAMITHTLGAGIDEDVIPMVSRSGRRHQRPLQGRSHSPAWDIAILRGGRVRHPRMD